MTSVLLLVAPPFRLPCRRQHILGITPGVGFFGNPASDRHAVGTYSGLRAPESRSEVTSFLMSVLRRGRAALSTGFAGSRCRSLTQVPTPILYHFGQATNPRRLG